LLDAGKNRKAMQATTALQKRKSALAGLVNPKAKQALLGLQVTHIPKHANTVQHTLAIAVIQTCLQIHSSRAWVSVSGGHCSELAQMDSARTSRLQERTVSFGLEKNKR